MISLLFLYIAGQVPIPVIMSVIKKKTSWILFITFSSINFALIFTFLAHIKDQASSSWYKFNDEVVQKLEGSEFQLGVEGELEGNHIKS